MSQFHVSLPLTLTTIMDTSSIATRGSLIESTAIWNFEDWEKLKDLFNAAAEKYESKLFLRNVIRTLTDGQMTRLLEHCLTFVQ